MASVFKRKPQNPYQGTPLHLTATGVLGPTETAGANSQALHNPIDEPIEAHAFKFGLNATFPAGTVAPQFSGASVGVNIQLNDQPITNGYVPLWCLGVGTNLANEQLQGGTTVEYGEWIWHLPRPLWIGEQDQLSVQFQHYGQTNQSFNTRFSVAGRSVTSRPAKRCLPYASAYISKVFQSIFANVADSDQSTEVQLANATPDVLRAQRISGRIDLFSNVDGQNLGVQSADVGADLLTCRLLTGHGQPMTPYSGLYRSIFPEATQSWELGDVPLAPGDYYIMALAAAASGGALAAVWYAQASAALVGWREVAT